VVRYRESMVLFNLGKAGFAAFSIFYYLCVHKAKS